MSHLPSNCTGCTRVQEGKRILKSDTSTVPIGIRVAHVSRRVAAKLEGRTRRRSAATPVVELIVRRSALRRFDKLKQATADLAVTLSWDRRTSERRLSPRDVEREHRQIERRKAPPFTWEVADFVVVEKPALRAPRAQAKTKRRL